ncbi:hypothetical protein [Devosia ginsengisoli]|uniref:hypothetical protein n=1 Tax=Devosia ginsengisoli TaxID=400770 RepID=UPI0026EA1D08|nr:hypothetical protein [Devosia ginsengisoli]MCR6673250.1 hypothetical protein [Devosia ginsengisoli]
MPKTPFPIPPMPEPWQEFPSAVALDARLIDLVGNDGRMTLLPFRLLAGQRGWDTTLGAVIERLSCADCGRRPSELAIVESAAGGAGRHTDREPGRLLIQSGP